MESRIEHNKLEQSSLDSRAKDVLNSVSQDIDFNKFLEKYGPEGLYIIANKLKEIADKDVNDALDQANNNFEFKKND